MLFFTLLKFISHNNDTHSNKNYTADDTAFIAHSHEDMQEIVACFVHAARAFGLKVNTKKTGDEVPAIPGY